MPSRRAPAASTQASTESAPREAVTALGPIIEAIGSLVILLDRHAVIRATNSACEKFFGLTAAAMTGRALFDFVHAGEREPYLQALESLDSGKIDEAGIRFRTTGLDFNTRSLPTITYRYNKGTELVFVLVGHHDITQSNPVSEIAVKFPALALGDWRHDIKTGRATWSEAVSRFLGQEAATNSFIRDYGLEYIAPDDRDHVRAIYLKAIADKKPFSFQAKVLTPDGETRLCQTMGMLELDGKGEPTALVGMSYDITQAVEASRAFHDSASELHELFAEISDVIFRTDARGRYMYVSPSVKHVLGYEAAELCALGRSSLSIIHPDDVPGVRETICALSSVGETVALTYRSLHKDGRWIWTESKVRAVLIGPNGMPAEIVSVSRDVTARKRTEEELAAALARAEAASATKSRFLANMSHELRTPLNAIIGFSDIIRRELFGPTGSLRYKEYAQLIQESGSHLLDLINDILDMSKVEAGKFDLRFEPVDLQDMIDSSLKLMEPRAQEGKLVLNAEYGSNAPSVQADRRAVKQILLNLITNAVKFTPPGGLITVSLQTLSDGVAIQVRDTGIGIAEKDLARVTLPFEQVTNDPLLAQSGSGLGLALVQSLVSLHMGTLKIDSVPGEGTVVTVFLPADPRTRRAA